MPNCVLLTGFPLCSARSRLIETMTVIVPESATQSTGQSDQISFGAIFSAIRSFSGGKSP
jgi:hypothetical protein